MEEVFLAGGEEQTEMFLRHLESKLPADIRIPEIGELSVLANSAKQSGDLQAALGFEESALALCEKLRNETDSTALLALTAAKFYNIGQLRYQLQDLDSANRSFEQACALDAASGNIVGEAADCRGLAFIKQDNGDFAAAIELHKKALEMNTRAGFMYGIATDQANIGVNYLELADPSLAKIHLREALHMFNALGRIEEATQISTLLTPLQ